MRWSDADHSRDASALAVLEGNGAIMLQLPCQQLAFRGNWGELPDSSVGFVGHYASQRPREPKPAIVLVLPAPAEPTAVGWLEMVDASGATLFGPWRMRRVDGATRVRGMRALMLLPQRRGDGAGGGSNSRGGDVLALQGVQQQLVLVDRRLQPATIDRMVSVPTRIPFEQQGAAWQPSGGRSCTPGCAATGPRPPR